MKKNIMKVLLISLAILTIAISVVNAAAAKERNIAKAMVDVIGPLNNDLVFEADTIVHQSDDATQDATLMFTSRGYEILTEDLYIEANDYARFEAGRHFDILAPGSGYIWAKNGLDLDSDHMHVTATDSFTLNGDDQVTIEANNNLAIETATLTLIGTDYVSLETQHNFDLLSESSAYIWARNDLDLDADYVDVTASKSFSVNSDEDIRLVAQDKVTIDSDLIVTGNVVLESPNGNLWSLSVNDEGQLLVEEHQ